MSPRKLETVFVVVGFVAVGEDGGDGERFHMLTGGQATGSRRRKREQIFTLRGKG